MKFSFYNMGKQKKQSQQAKAHLLHTYPVNVSAVVITVAD